MPLTRFRITNYKSYYDTPEVELTTGFNVVVGQNNAGKTALIEALSLRFSNSPHRSLRTVPTRNTAFGGASQIHVLFDVSRDELASLLVELGGAIFIRIPGLDTSAELARLQDVLTHDIHLEATFNAANGVFSSATILEHPYEARPGASTSVQLQRDNRGSRGLVPLTHNLHGDQDYNYYLPWLLATRLRERIYAFRAERLNIGSTGIGSDRSLAPNASNLALVLNLLQSANPAAWDEYIHAVRTVLPQLQAITVPPGGNGVEVLVWNISTATKRDDLAIRLSESGTGIGQVLAILYVVLTAEVPRTILIDEPQSFLHPGAVRKLLDICRLHPQHQYVITTHSATAVSAAAPRTLLLVRSSENESSIETLNVADTVHLRRFLHDVGARLADVFGADWVLWVEGATEEECFPLILAGRPEIPITALSILAVTSTGDFSRRDAQRTFDVYSRLSKGPKLLPAAVGFLFDRELRTQGELADLERRSGGLIRFTGRRMFESYLLDSEALAAIMSMQEGFLAEGETTSVSKEMVDGWLEANRWRPGFFVSDIPEENRNDSFWLNEVDAASLLEAMFGELSQHRVIYRKIEHGVALTAWLVAHKPVTFDQIAETIQQLLASAPQLVA